MQDTLSNEERHPVSPFQINTGQQPTREVDTALFIKAAFEESPSKGLELLFRRFYKPLCSHAVRFVYSRQIAEDLVSEVFFQFYRTR
ncbi:MAG TPA: RNA polymerase sigma-70 factor, partial [Dyadobacter sp.]|nr:RNA polymerase sigma-70 factor [Dyadobacter sp.]